MNIRCILRNLIIRCTSPGLFKILIITCGLKVLILLEVTRRDMFLVLMFVAVAEGSGEVLYG